MHIDILESQIHLRHTHRLHPRRDPWSGRHVRNLMPYSAINALFHYVIKLTMEEQRVMGSCASNKPSHPAYLRQLFEDPRCEIVELNHAQYFPS